MGWDTSRVASMMPTFSGVNSFDQPIGGWDTSKVTTMSGMFNCQAYPSKYCIFNQPLGGWDSHEQGGRDDLHVLLPGPVLKKKKKATPTAAAAAVGVAFFFFLSTGPGSRT